MFTELHKLLAGRKACIAITVTDEGDNLRVCVLPPKDKDLPTLKTALTFCDTPAAIDAEFPARLAAFTAKRTTVAEGIEAAEKNMEAEKPKPKAGTPAKPTVPPPRSHHKPKPAVAPVKPTVPAAKPSAPPEGAATAAYPPGPWTNPTRRHVPTADTTAAAPETTPPPAEPVAPVDPVTPAEPVTTPAAPEVEPPPAEPTGSAPSDTSDLSDSPSPSASPEGAPVHAKPADLTPAFI